MPIAGTYFGGYLGNDYPVTGGRVQMLRIIFGLSHSIKGIIGVGTVSAWMASMSQWYVCSFSCEIYFTNLHPTTITHLHPCSQSTAHHVYNNHHPTCSCQANPQPTRGGSGGTASSPYDANWCTLYASRIGDISPMQGIWFCKVCWGECEGVNY